ncbi:MAG: glycerol-3-phosphate dehydrogenase [Pseudomonadota bacterium]
MAGNDCVDLLVVGGGINGAGIARDAAGRGLKVALVEQDDLANATSSASTKLIHGGLRYLEFAEFRLVRESLMERERLLAIAPHIIRPMQFVLPHVEGLRSRWLIRVGLFFYDHAGGRRSLPGSRGTRLAGTGFGQPLNPAIAHGFVYSDCWVDDSRLVVLNAMDAAERGADIRPRTRFLSATPCNGVWTAACQELIGGRQFEIRARAVVNAAGPWVGNVLQQLQQVPRQGPQVRLVKGSHIVVRKLYEGDHAYTLQNPDGRVVFTIPCEDDYTAIGTTDVAFAGDVHGAVISEEEISYLCATINQYFTSRRLTPADVIWSYAGVRPLFDDAAADISKVTRDYKLELQTESGGAVALSVFGGKITTYRKLAEAVLARLQPLLGGSTASWTAGSPLPGGDLPHSDPAQFLAECHRRWPQLPPQLIGRMARSYGTRIERVLADVRSLEDMGRQHGAGLSDTEVMYLRTNEWAHSASDILWRRTKLGLHMSPQERATFEQTFVSTSLRRSGAV